MTSRTCARMVCVALPLALSAMTPCRDARADEASDTAAARVLGGDGILLADAGKCNQALEKLARAEKLHHAHTTAARLGECEIETGKIVQGTERLQRVIREPLAQMAPQPAVAAVERARVVLEKALPRIAMLRISVKAPTGTKLHVTVDGEPLPDVLLDNERPTDPGSHTVRVSAEGYFPESIDTSLGEGELKSVRLELRPAPPAVTSAAAREPPLPGAAGTKTPAIVAFVLGGLGLAVGATSGLVVARKASSLEDSCSPSRTCPADKQNEIDSAKTLATISTVGFIVGGAGIGTGVVLLAIDDRSSAVHSGGVVVRPVVSASYVGLNGAF